jgi:PAS domain S-box-containing protein
MGWADGDEESDTRATEVPPDRGVTVDSRHERAAGFLLDATADAVVVVDTTGRIDTCNRAAGRLLGHPPESLAGRSASQVMIAGDGAGIIQRALAGSRLTGARTSLVRADGSSTPVSVHSGPVDGTVVLVLRDESERVESQEALARLHGQLSSLQALGGLGLWRWVPEHDEVQWSDHLFELHAIDPLAFDGTLAAHVAPIREEEREQVRAKLQEAARTGTALEVEYVIIRPDGEHRAVCSTSEPLRDSRGEVVALTGALQDVTEDRRIRARIETANASLERVAAVIAHDLRSPLVAIAGFAELLTERSALEGEDAEFLERIQANTNRALDLLEDIVDEARRDPLAPAGEVNLEDVAEWATDVLADWISHRSAEIEIDELPNVQGHEASLRQVLLNLLGNSLKFHRGPAPPRIRISAPELTDVVELRVDDNGPGVPADERAAIFEEGYRGPRGVEDGIQGSGLGLATVRRIAERHGSRVTVGDSDLGGARFALRLRRAHPSS